MSERFVIDDNGLRWDRVTALGPRPNPDDEQHYISVAGLVDGDDGVLVLRLPGMCPADYLLSPAEARALRDALLARVLPSPGKDGAP